MNSNFSNPQRANQVNQGPPASSTQRSHKGKNAPAHGQGLPNESDLVQHPRVASAQPYAPIKLPSIEGIIPRQEPQPLAGSSDQLEKKPAYKGFFAMITTLKTLMELKERIFEDFNHHFFIRARVTTKPRDNLSDTFFDLDVVGRDRQMSDDLYVAFGFSKGHNHVDFSSAICRSFCFKRFGTLGKGKAVQRKVCYKLQQLGHGVAESYSDAVGILGETFEEKARAAYSRSLQLFLPNLPGDHRKAFEGSTAGPSNSRSTQAPSFSVVGDVEYRQKERTDPWNQFPQPLPTTRQPHLQHSSFLQAVAPAAQYPSSASWALPPSERTFESRGASQDGHETAFGNNASTFTIQGGRLISMPTYPAFPTAPSVPWYKNSIANSLGAGTNVPVYDPGHWANYPATSGYANYDFTYHHTTTAPTPGLTNYQAQNSGLNYDYSSVDRDQDAPLVPSHLDVPISGSSGTQFVSTSNPAISHDSPPPPPPIPTPTSPEPVETPPVKRGRGRPRKAQPKKTQTTRFNPYPQSLRPNPHLRSGPSNPYPRITPPSPVEVPQETTVVQPAEPVYGVVTAEAQTHNLVQGTSFPQPMSGFYYPPSYYNTYQHTYQPGLVPQHSSFTYVSQAASSSTYGVPTFAAPQPQRSFLESELRRVDDMDYPSNWWDPNLQNYDNGGFQ